MTTSMLVTGGTGTLGRPVAQRPRAAVLISVVGADRVPQVSAIDRALFGYFGMKLAT